MKILLTLIALNLLATSSLMADQCRKTERPTGCLAPDPICVVGVNPKDVTENCHLTYDQSQRGQRGLKLCNDFSWESCCFNLCINKVSPNRKIVRRDQPSVSDVPRKKQDAFQGCLAQCSFVTPLY